jgi:uncharacterized protein YndB with AHSA1/START domain
LKNTRIAGTVALLLFMTSASIANAEVVESSANSMKIRHVVNVSAPPAKAWQSLVAIGSWWSGEHTYSGDASRLRLEPRAGGCWCESLPDGGSVQHMTVLLVEPNQRMTLGGGLGPLQSAGVAGAMTFQITAKDGGSKIELVYNVGGFFPGGLNAVAPGVDGVLGMQFARLGRLIDTGSAGEPPAKK